MQPGQPARGDRHRAAGHGALQRHASTTTSPTAGPGATHDEIVAAARLAQIHDFIASTARGLRDAGRRARPQALRRREAARRHRPRDAQGPAHPDLRRGDSALDSKSEKAIQAELRRIAREPHDADDRPPAVDDRRRRRDPGARRTAASSSAGRMARFLPRTACTRGCGSCSRRNRPSRAEAMPKSVNFRRRAALIRIPASPVESPDAITPVVLINAARAVANKPIRCMSRVLAKPQVRAINAAHLEVRLDERYASRLFF